MSKIRKVIVGIIIGIIVLALAMPIVASFMNQRTIINELPLVIWDTSLTKEVLDEHEFADAQIVHNVLQSNPISRILNLLIIRRIRVVDARETKTGFNNAYPGNNEYHLRMYTYFNIPIWDTKAHMGGETSQYDAPALKEY